MPDVGRPVPTIQSLAIEDLRPAIMVVKVERLRLSTAGRDLGARLHGRHLLRPAMRSSRKTK
jgi:hypothetical protein